MPTVLRNSATTTTVGACSGAWAAHGVSSEPWLADATWLTDLKLRADYGVIGNQNGIGRYAGYLTWSYGSTGNSTPGSFKPDGWKISQGSAAAALTWEKKKTVDVGLDFRLWDRFYGTLDWYQTNTTDMIWNAPTNYAATGQSSIAANSAELRTRGFEFELGVDIIKTPDILWSFGVNGAHYKTILTKVPERHRFGQTERYVGSQSRRLDCSRYRYDQQRCVLPARRG